MHERGVLTKGDTIEYADAWLAKAFKAPAPAETVPPRRQVETVRPRPETMEAWLGASYSPELDRTWWIVTGDSGTGEYLLRRRDFPDVELSGPSGDSLAVSGATIRPVRAGGAITGLNVSARRVLELRFERVERR